MRAGATETNYGDFSLGLHRRTLARRVPIDGTVEITRRCPLKCTHCYNNLPLNDPESRRKELSYEEHCRLLDEITQAGCLWLLYTGGEIFARKDFLDIYTYAKQKGLLITLFTNGTLITSRIADTLAEWPPFSIEITLYGRSKETYEEITGVSGSFERCLRGIHLLLERGLPLKIKTLVVTLNQHEIWEMKKFVEEELNLEFRFDAMINPRIDCGKTPLRVRLKPEEIVGLDLLDAKRMAEWHKFAGKFTGPLSPPERANELYQCGGGLNSFAIDPYGKMGLCLMTQEDKWNLREDSFQKGWESFVPEVRRRKIKKQSKCTACEIKALCGMCPANGFLENRDCEEPVDFLCRVAHLRAKAIGLSVKPHGECSYCGILKKEVLEAGS
jgi:radical SAM protein with 4Fe4S-binding SPASM domain